MVRKSRHPHRCGVPEGCQQTGLVGVEGAELREEGEAHSSSTRGFWAVLDFSLQIAAKSLQEAGPPPSQKLQVSPEVSERFRLLWALGFLF